jgi:hypothetical protein
MRKDEKRHGRLADAAADLMSEGGGSPRVSHRGSAWDPATVKTRSLRNLLDAVSTFRAGR